MGPISPLRSVTPRRSEPEAKGERRSAVRHPASAVPSITGLRFSPHGADAVLVNISTTGLLAECRERFKLGGKVTVLVEGTFAPQSIAGSVDRSSVASLGADGRLRYHVGIAFTEPITLDAEQAVDSPAPPAPVQPLSPALTAPVLRNRW